MLSASYDANGLHNAKKHSPCVKCYANPGFNSSINIKFAHQSFTSICVIDIQFYMRPYSHDGGGGGDFDTITV